MNRKQLKDIIQNKLGIRQNPHVLQMPITSRCNSRCKTCNVWKEKDLVDIDPVRLKTILAGKFFSEVSAVGINGGEFTLVPNFLEILKAVLTLPKLSSVHLITNGLFPKRLFEYLQETKSLCTEKNVSLNICLSIDGIGEIHERVRGVPNCWNKSLEIIEEIYNNTTRYCNRFSIGCTLSQYNIEYVREIENFFKSYPGLSIEYHIAVPNRRIRTFNDYQDYYLLQDEKLRMLATEFFYEKFLFAKSENEKRQMFVNYYFLKNKGRGRLCKCDYLNRDVTIDENLNVVLCATASREIGNLQQDSVESIFKQNARREARQLRRLCDTCVHYSYHTLTIRGRIKYIHELIKAAIYEYYEIKATPSWWSRNKRLLRFYLRITKQYLRMVYSYIWKLQ